MRYKESFTRSSEARGSSRNALKPTLPFNVPAPLPGTEAEIGFGPPNFSTPVVIASACRCWKYSGDAFRGACRGEWTGLLRRRRRSRSLRFAAIAVGRRSWTGMPSLVPLGTMRRLVLINLHQSLPMQFQQKILLAKSFVILQQFEQRVVHL